MGKSAGPQWPRIRAVRKDPPVKQTNHYFAQLDKKFKITCKKAGIEPTRRQASKYRTRRGRAYASTI